MNNKPIDIIISLFQPNQVREPSFTISDIVLYADSKNDNQNFIHRVQKTMKALKLNSTIYKKSKYLFPSDIAALLIVLDKIDGKKKYSLTDIIFNEDFQVLSYYTVCVLLDCVNDVEGCIIDTKDKSNNIASQIDYLYKKAEKHFYNIDQVTNIKYYTDNKTAPIFTGQGFIWENYIKHNNSSNALSKAMIECRSLLYSDVFATLSANATAISMTYAKSSNPNISNVTPPPIVGEIYNDEYIKTLNIINSVEKTTTLFSELVDEDSFLNYYINNINYNILSLSNVIYSLCLISCPSNLETILDDKIKLLLSGGVTTHTIKKYLNYAVK